MSYYSPKLHRSKKKVLTVRKDLFSLYQGVPFYEIGKKPQVSNKQYLSRRVRHKETKEEEEEEEQRERRTRMRIGSVPCQPIDHGFFAQAHPANGAVQQHDNTSAPQARLARSRQASLQAR